MATQEAEAAYYRYLTERMDRGQSKNIVIPTAVDLILKHLETKDTVCILDVGCFNGAMLNQIRLNTPIELRDRVKYTGAEIERSLIEDGKVKYPELNFEKVNLDQPLPDIPPQDVVILSNVIHEVIPNEARGLEVDDIVQATIKKVSDLIVTGGDLLILDGLRPDNDDQLVEVKFAQNDQYGLFQLFAQRYTAFDVQTSDLGVNTIRTRVKDLAAFMTKARYLFEGYWDIESHQLYQYFNREQFVRALETSGLTINLFEPQGFTEEHLKNIFEHTKPHIEYPAKNVLIVANKVV